MSETPYDDDTILDDSIISDLSLLGIEVDDTIELDVNRNTRIALILTKSQSGLDLFNNIERYCPISGGTIGKTLVMKRCVKHFINKNKLAKDFTSVGWKSAPDDMISKVTDIFSRSKQ